MLCTEISPNDQLLWCSGIENATVLSSMLNLSQPGQQWLAGGLREHLSQGDSLEVQALLA